MAGTPKGKGGNFDTRRNPFDRQIRAVAGAPELANCTRLGLALDLVMRAGCATIIGTTRDGGAVVLTILDGDDRHRTYCANEKELDDAISAIEELYGS